MSEQLDNPPQVEVTEGRARILLPSNAVGKVFYNPKMSLCRDLAVLLTASHFPAERELCICDPMTASGVRAARYLLESSNVCRVVAADKETEAVESARRTIKLNGLENKAAVVESDANLLLTQHMNDRFDLVDLDPFGSPAPFFESAMRATAEGGIVAATATDMGPLTGARPVPCHRKYGAKPVRTEFEKELAIRILAGCLASVAGRLELGIEIIFSHASDHYARLYALLTKGRTAANTTVKSLGFLEYCSKCLRRNSSKSLNSIQPVCPNCGSQVKVGGPLWVGGLWSKETVAVMEARIPTIESLRLSEMQATLSRIGEEAEAPPFHYRTDFFARTLGRKPLGITRVVDALRDSGNLASRTHFAPNGFRTDARIDELSALLRSLAEKP